MSDFENHFQLKQDSSAEQVPPLSLAFCITELNVGGAERIFCELARRLDKNRFRVTVYSLQARPTDENASCVHMLEEAGVPVHFLNMKGYLSTISGFRRLKQLLVQDKPDLFLSFLFHANFLGRLAARLAKVPLVVSGIRVAEHRCLWHLRLDRWTQRLVDRYVCVGQSIAEFSEQIGKLPRQKLAVIPNGIDIHSFPDKPVERENRIVYIGRLDYQKGLDWFFETLPDWLPQLPGGCEPTREKSSAENVFAEKSGPKSSHRGRTKPRKESVERAMTYESCGSVIWQAAQPFWEMIIVGDGPDRKLLTEKWLSTPFDEIRHRVHIIGWRKDAVTLLPGAKMFVLPSRWEGMPNVLLQAMAAGLPVVASDVDGVPELLGPDAEPQTFAFGDAAQLADRIRYLAENPEIAHEIGQRNRQRVEEHFSLDLMVHRYEEMFLDLYYKRGQIVRNGERFESQRRENTERQGERFIK